MIRNSSAFWDCRAEIAEQGIRTARYVRKRRKRSLISAILLSAVILAAALSARFPVKSESNGPGSEAETMVRFSGTRLLSHGAEGGGPEYRCTAAESGGPPQIGALISHGRKYSVLISAQNVEIYDRATRVSGYDNDSRMETISSCIADYDGDGNDDVFLLLKRQGQQYGEKLVILSFDGRKTEKTYDESFRKVNPWKVQVCDVDGDGKPEVSLGVFTVAKYHPIYAKRPFLYEFSNHRLYPKWLGSRLSQPFEDYVFCDVDGDKKDELIALETTREGKKELDAYQWTGFGFESIGVSQSYDTIRNLRASHGSVTAVCAKSAAPAFMTFTYRNEKLVAGG